MSERKRTKTEKSISLPVKLEEAQWVIEDSDNRAIARSCAEPNTTKEQMRANSEFICLAVNNHDKLVEALRLAESALREANVTLNGGFHTEYREVKKALKLINSH